MQHNTSYKPPHTTIGDNRRSIRSSLTSPKLHLATCNQAGLGGGEAARIRKDSQIERNRSAKISKQHCKGKGSATQKPCKSPKGLPHRSHTVQGKTTDCISSSLTLPKLYIATYKHKACLSPEILNISTYLQVP